MMRALPARLGSPASASTTVPCTTGSASGSINACSTVREGGGRWLPRAGRAARWGLLREGRRGSASGSSKTISTSHSTYPDSYMAQRESKLRFENDRTSFSARAREAEAVALLVVDPLVRAPVALACRSRHAVRGEAHGKPAQVRPCLAVCAPPLPRRHSASRVDLCCTHLALATRR